MGVAVYPRIENTNADWVHDISGKALSKGMDTLFKLIKKQGFKDLMYYYVSSEEELEDLGLKGKAETVWYDPREGLALIDAMTSAFNANQALFARPDHLENDLNAFRAILNRAASEGLRWNLGMSY